MVKKPALMMPTFVSVKAKAKQVITDDSRMIPEQSLLALYKSITCRNFAFTMTKVGIELKLEFQPVSHNLRIKYLCQVTNS